MGFTAHCSAASVLLARADDMPKWQLIAHLCMRSHRMQAGNSIWVTAWTHCLALDMGTPQGR